MHMQFQLYDLETWNQNHIYKANIHLTYDKSWRKQGVQMSRTIKTYFRIIPIS